MRGFRLLFAALLLLPLAAVGVVAGLGLGVVWSLGVGFAIEAVLRRMGPGSERQEAPAPEPGANERAHVRRAWPALRANLLRDAGTDELGVPLEPAARGADPARAAAAGPLRRLGAWLA